MWGPFLPVRLLVSGILLLGLAGARAETIYVDNFGDTGEAGQLRAAIIYANLHQNVEIVLRPTEAQHEIVLSSALPILFQGVTIRSEGMATTINGNHQHRAFFVDAPDATVQLQNLTIANGHAQGGNGGAGGQGGGGGLGAGGAIFVNSGYVQVSNVSFSSNSAQGGKGGNEILAGTDQHGLRLFRTGGGGGGLGGNGGDADVSAGGGGGGFAGNGGNGHGFNDAFHLENIVGGGGGGGGLYGNGGAGQPLAGGGGGGSLENGGDGVDRGSAGAGGVSHGGVGGQGTSASGASGSGIGGGGGGGSGNLDHGGAGGAGAKYAGGGGAGGASLIGAAHGGNGGDFGGGGGTGSERRYLGDRDRAGVGGFGGGGGGSNSFSGTGGFGGGEGGGEVLDNQQGYGAGAAGTGGPNPNGGFPAAVGGGGAALGGAIFVRAETGGSLTVVDSSIQNSSVTGGLPGDYSHPSHGTPGHAGTGQGSAMFLHGGTTTISVTAVSQTIDGTIADAQTGGYAAGNLTKTGAGYLFLLADNTYHGTTTVSGGKLQLGNGGTAGSILGPLVNNAVFEVHRSNDWTYANVMSGSGTFVKSGLSTLTLTGNNAAYGGQFQVNEGKLRINSGGKIGSSGASIIGNAAGKTAAMELNGTEWTDHGTVHVGSSGTGEFTVANGAHFSGATLLIGSAAGSAGTVTVTGTNSTLTITDSEIIVGASGTGTLLINNGGSIQRGLNVGRDAGSSGTVIVDGAGSVLNGSVLLGDHGAGRLVIKNGATFTGPVAMGYQQGSGILDIGDYETPSTSGNISISQIAVNSGTGIVRFNQTDTVTISGGIHLGAALYQRGSGTTVLTGTDNTYSGGTFVTNGVLSVNNAKSLGHGPVTIDGGTLRNTAAFSESQQVSLGNAGGTIETLANLDLAQPITGSGALTKTGTAVLNITGNQSYAGLTTVQAGTLHMAVGSLSSSVSVSAGAGFILGESSHYGGTLSGAGALRVTGDATWTGMANHTGGTVIESGRLLVGDGTVNGKIGGSVALNGGSLEFRSVGSEPVVFNDVLSGEGMLVKDGAGAVHLYGNSSNFSGPVELRDGILGIGHLHALGTGVFSIKGGALRALVVSQTIGNEISLEGNFALGHHLTLSGEIQVAANVTITSANSEPFIAAASSSLSGTIWGSGRLTFTTGANPNTSIILSGWNSFSGGMALQAGRLVADHNHALGTGNAVVSGGTLAIANGRRVTNTIFLSGGAYERTLTGSLAHAVDATSDFGGTATTASILAGSTALTTLTTSFSLGDSETLSDIYSLHGTGANLFVLQLSFASIAPGSYLGWQNGGDWLNAREGNTNNNPLFADPFSGSFTAFQLAHGTDLSAYIGAWGTDVTGGITSTWAVLNHNSGFAVLAVPEPGTVTLLMAAFLAAGMLWFRRNRQGSNSDHSRSRARV